MSFENKYIFFLCALGVFNCVLVSGYFLLFDRQKRPQNRLFGLLTLLVSIKVGKTLYMAFGNEKNLMYAQIGLLACLLIGITLHYYVKASLDKVYRMPTPWKWHIGLWVCLALGVGFLKPYDDNINFWNNYLVWFIYLVWGAYIMMCGILLRKNIAGLFLYKGRNTTEQIWSVSVFTGNVLVYLAYIVGFYWLYLVEMLTFSFVFYTVLLIFLGLKNRAVVFQGIPEKYGSLKIEDDEANALQEKLALLMYREELFKNPNLKLIDVAKRMNVSQHKLSQFLNDNLGTSFSSFINQKRIDKAIKILGENNRITLEAVGYESGFSTKSVFYSTFKKVTGKTPSSFRKETR